jgi:maltooligosyltrehalose trehalohydrolase
LLTGENAGYFADYGRVGDLATVLGENFCLTERFSKFRQRMYGHSAKSITSSHFVAFSQNHDQTGNRAYGERLCHLVNNDQIKLCAAVTLLSPFIPMLFQGEEWAASSPFCYFADLSTEEIRRALREGRREEFSFYINDSDSIPDPCDETTWRQSQLKWQERESEPHRDMLEWYRALIQLRTQNADFATSQSLGENIEYTENPGWMTLRRGKFRVIYNFSHDSALITCCDSDQLKPVLSSNSAAGIALGGNIRMPAHSVAVFENVAESNTSGPKRLS